MVSHSPPDVRLPLLKKVAWESIQVRCSVMLRYSFHYKGLVMKMVWLTRIDYYYYKGLVTRPVTYWLHFGSDNSLGNCSA
jgi:hypothetical protein